jgi:DNA-binding NtrC family response regulator
MTIERICLIEDDAIMGESLLDRLQLEGYAVRWYRHGAQALDAIPKQNFGLVLSDIRLPDIGGDEVFKRLARLNIALPPFVFITAYGTIERAVDLLRLGAVDYLTKPFDIENLLKKLRMYVRVNQPASALEKLAQARSPAMAKISGLLPKFARSDGPLLLTGESGVGKEHIARIIHELDEKRCHKPFIAINCGAIAETLAESELFGHERGAFTGAVKLRRGAFEQAEDGILFLDEIGDLPPALQVKLLRVIEDKRITRVGGEISIPAGCRVIAATNRKVDDEISRGAFRADLFYRLNALHINIPPLRERREEIAALAKIFLASCNQRSVEPAKIFAAESESALYLHEWPGNIRELKHCVERAHLVCDGNIISRQDLFENEHQSSAPTAGSGLQLDSFIAQQERAFLIDQLARHTGKIALTAATLGISRKTLWEKMRKHAITAIDASESPDSL